MKGDTVSLGVIQNPLVDWEEQMYGYRYVNLTPWNYLSFSSTQEGISVQGPIKFNELQYVDYDAGVCNNSSFHAFEHTNTKQVMGRRFRFTSVQQVEVRRTGLPASMTMAMATSRGYFHPSRPRRHGPFYTTGKKQRVLQVSFITTPSCGVWLSSMKSGPRRFQFRQSVLVIRTYW